MKTSYLQLFFLIFCFISVQGQTVNSKSSKEQLLDYHQSHFDEFEHVTDQLIVKFSAGVDLSRGILISDDPALASAVSDLAVEKADRLFVKDAASHKQQRDAFGLDRFFVLHFKPGTDLKAAMKTFASLAVVEMVEPNYIAHETTVPNDPYYSQQWALNNTGQAVQYGSGNPVGTPGVDLGLEQAWNMTTGSSDVVVSILDGGVDLTHPEFAGRLVAGYDFVFDDNDPMPGDGNAHGTACAGIVAASGNNNLGVAGIAWGVSIMPVKVMHGGSGSYTDIASGITWSANNYADILSMSLSGEGYSYTLETAVNFAYGLGCAIFASAGNNNEDLTPNPRSPAVFVNTICVGALSPCNERKSPSSCDGESWWGSNFGSDMDFMAPGTRNYTTDISGTGGYSVGDYAPFFNGTSSACPHAAGVAALIKSFSPGISNSELRTLMQNTCVDMGTPGKDDQTGYGRINAYNALMAVALPTCSVSFTPDQQTVMPGQEFSVEIWVEDVENLASYEFNISYEPDYMDFMGYDLGDFVYSTGRTQLPFWVEPDPVNGYFYFRQGTSGPEPPGPDGTGRLFTANFKAKDEPLGLETLQFNVVDYEMTTPDGSQIFANLNNATVTLGDYCTEGLYYNGCFEGDRLNYVAMADMENTTDECDSGAYSDYTDMFISVLQGYSYDVTLSAGYDSQYVSAWIDLDDNLAFEEDEKVLDDFYLENAFIQGAASVFIGDDFPEGQHRMRFRTVYNTPDFSPCGVYAYGEVEDYTVSIYSKSDFSQIDGYVYNQQTLDPIVQGQVEVSATGLVDETSQSGYFSFIVMPGTYNLECSAPGYTPATSETFSVGPGEEFYTEFYLEHATCSDNLYETGCVEGDGIEDFYLEQINHPASGCSENGYGDFTNMTAILSCGQTYQCEVSTLYGDQYLNIWIDFNDDYVFQPEERVLENAYMENYEELYQFDITLPADCNPGSHIMRARANYTDPFDDPCALLEYGEVHDYTVQIGDPANMGSLHGFVYNWDVDAPQSGVEIQIYEYGVSTTSNIDGSYDFGMLPEGPVNLMVNQPEYFSNSTFAEVYAGYDSQQDVVVYPIHQNYFNLSPGWSGLSSVFFINRQVGEIFGSQEDNFTILSSQSGFYYPGGNVNTLNGWEDSPGYMIKASQPISFEYPGWMRKPAVLTVPSGWSILPAWSDCQVATHVLFDISGNPQPEIIKEIGGSGVYWPAMDVNTLPIIKPFKAYMAYFETGGDLYYPLCFKQNVPETITHQTQNLTTWNTPVATASSHVVNISTDLIKSAGIQPGDFLGIFDAAGDCYGLEAVFENENVAIPAFGDDPTTPGKDGFAEGDEMYIKAFTTRTSETSDLDVEWETDLPNRQYFIPEGLSSVTLKNTGTSGTGRVQHFLRVYPNPTDGILNIALDNPEVPVTIRVMDVSGQVVRSLQHTPATSAGDFQIDLSGLTPGVYSVKFVLANEVYEQKVVLK